MIKRNFVYNADVLQGLGQLPDKSVHCCVTSPPYYGLRDYDHPDQIGMEKTPELYIEKLVKVFAQVHRVLRNDGTLWVNIGDSYWGGKGRNGASWDTDNNLGKINAKAQNIWKPG